MTVLELFLCINGSTTWCLIHGISRHNRSCYHLNTSLTPLTLRWLWMEGNSNTALSLSVFFSCCFCMTDNVLLQLQTSVHCWLCYLPHLSHICHFCLHSVQVMLFLLQGSLTYGLCCELNMCSRVSPRGFPWYFPCDGLKRDTYTTRTEKLFIF